MKLKMINGKIYEVSKNTLTMNTMGTKKYKKFLELCSKAVKFKDLKIGFICYNNFQKFEIISEPYFSTGTGSLVIDCKTTFSEGQDDEFSVKDDFIIRLSSAESKPNPKLLEHICLTENVDIKDAVYVGDSITKDISMAKSIGMKAVWARYGRQFAPELWEILVKITHWTDKDVEREEQLKESFSRVKPDYSINSFAEILDLM